MLTILDRYVLKQVARPLAASLGIGLAMLLAERLVRLLDITLGKKNSFGVVFEMLAYLVPHYLGTAVPAALFLGLLFGFNSLSKSHEIEAMMSSGVGLHRLLRPALMLALVFSMASLAIFGWLQPMTRYAYRSVLFDVKNVDAFYLAEEGVFMQAGSRTFIIDKLNRSNNSFQHVFIFDYKGRSGAETLTATSGVLVPVQGQPRPVLHLESGHRLSLEEWPNVAGQGQPPMASIGEFEKSDTPLGRINKDIFRPRGDDERELTLPEIKARMDNPPKGTTVAAMRAEYHRRIVNIVAMLILPFLAIPFAVGQARSPRAYRMAVALVLLVAFHEIIEQGAVASRVGNISPWLTLWAPMGAFAAFAFWQFYRKSFTISGDGFDRVIAPLHEALARFAARFRRKPQEANP